MNTSTCSKLTHNGKKYGIKYNRKDNPVCWCGFCGQWKPKDRTCPDCGLLMRTHARRSKKEKPRI